MLWDTHWWAGSRQIPELSVPEGVNWSAGGMCRGDPPASPPSSWQDM